MIKNCPKCGIPVNGFSVCPMCGEDLQKHELSLIEKTTLKKWDVALVIIFNLAFLCVLINALSGGYAWSVYAVSLIIALYFTAFVCASKTAKKFVTRLRNAVIIGNTILSIGTLLLYFLNGARPMWTTDLFMPITLILSNVIILSVGFIKKVSIYQVFFSACAFFLQGLVLLILLLFGIVGKSDLSRILIIIAAALNLATIVNLAFVIAFKCKKFVLEEIHLWE